jgi:hypothetical protein
LVSAGSGAGSSHTEVCPVVLLYFIPLILYCAVPVLTRVIGCAAVFLPPFLRSRRRRRSRRTRPRRHRGRRSRTRRDAPPPRRARLAHPRGAVPRELRVPAASFV